VSPSTTPNMKATLQPSMYSPFQLTCRNRNEFGLAEPMKQQF
jgi:hypothetical protein